MRCGSRADDVKSSDTFRLGVALAIGVGRVVDNCQSSDYIGDCGFDCC